jgi:DNA modification methylase
MEEATMSSVDPIHPFPARMAPEIALAQCESLPEDSLVLDPMCGSGTVLRTVCEKGHRALGLDLDPLAVLMASVYTTPLDAVTVRAAADDLRRQAQALCPNELLLPWIDAHEETCRYVDYWFAEPQRTDLRRLSHLLRAQKGALGDALRLALSRIIVTKDRGASLARDVSHSRPHRVKLTNDFPVLAEFVRAAQRLARQLEQQPPPGRAQVWQGDARQLSSVAEASVDAVITSPPYLNALDYLRGHRLALVWLGHRVSDLREIRSGSIGAERHAEPGSDLALADELTAALSSARDLPGRERGMLERYALDLHALVAKLHQVVRPGGRLVLVVGNSCLHGVFVDNASLAVAAAERIGWRPTERTQRELPPNRRYLPPPAAGAIPMLQKRMRTETVLTFSRS